MLTCWQPIVSPELERSMNQTTTSTAPRIRATLREALALFFWQFKKNFLVLFLLMLLGVFVRYKCLAAVKALMPPGQPVNSLPLESLTELTTTILLWFTLYVTAVLMAYLDVVRRLLGVPLYLTSGREVAHYLLWLFKKFWVATGVMTVMFLVFVLVMAGYNGVALLAVNLLPTVGLSIFGNKAVLISFTLFVTILLIAHYFLLTYPIVIDRNEGVFKSIKTGFFLVKWHRHFSYQMSMLWLVIFFSQFLFLQMYVHMHQMLLAWGWSGVAQACMMFVPALASLFINWFLLCLQVAVYRALTKKALQSAFTVVGR